MLAKTTRIMLVVAIALFVVSVPAMAADDVEVAKAEAATWAYVGAGVAAGLATIGGAYGIGKLATGAMEGTARQPEAGGAIRVTMIIAAALIEGFTFFAIIVAMQLAGK